MSVENISNLNIAILNTIAFYDLFDYPLTAWEIWKYLPAKADYKDVLHALSDELAFGNRIGRKNCFYFIKGRSETVAIRSSRYRSADPKYKKAIFVASILKFLPWIKLIAIGNIIGAHNAKADSDIDLFIATARRRIFLARFFSTLLVKLLGWRPKEGDMRDKICLSFYVSEEAMNLQSLMLDSEKVASRKPLVVSPEKNLNFQSDSGLFDDPYLIHWLANLKIIYERDGTAEKMRQANGWLKEYLPNFFFPEIVPSKAVKNHRLAGVIGAPLELLLGWTESRLKAIQLKIMPSALKCAAEFGDNVVINDQMLKFHLNDRREHYRSHYVKRIECILSRQD